LGHSLREADVQGDEHGTREQLVSELADAHRLVGEARKALDVCTAKLKASREEFETFAYIVSHDLRNPLINLKGFASELRSSFEAVRPAIDVALPHLSEEQRQAVVTAYQQDAPEALEFIESSVARIEGFINAVLKLSRLERRELRFEPIDMTALVHKVLETLTDQIEAHKAKVTVGPLPEVVADRVSMEEIMAGILTNAVIYLTNDRSGEIGVAGQRTTDETIIHVRDNGRGIAAEDVRKVFEPFRRAGKQDVPGQGMGLPYAKTLIQRHGGRLWCESELGVGTTFVFTISNRLVKGEAHA
jgi:signal transduction histidine kinase